MEVKLELNRRFFFDFLLVLELILLIIYGFQLSKISKKLAAGVPSQAVAAPNAPSNDAPPAQAASPVKKVAASEYVRGDKNAPVTLIEYSDFECPFCKTFHPSVTKLLDEYKGKLKMVYRHYPLSFHANAQKEAEASECVGSLGGASKFFEFGDKIFQRTTANGTGFPLENLPKLAAELGVDQKKFQECLDSGKFAEKVQTDLAEGADAGVNGTPGSFILVDKTGKQSTIEGAQPYEVLKRAVEAALKTL